MRRIYADWDDVKSEVRCNPASKLSFGVLLVGSKQLESHLNDTRMSDSYLIAFLEGIASQYPDAIEVFQLLSGSVRSILAHEGPMQGTDMDQVVARIKAVLGEDDGQDELPSLHKPLERASCETKELSGVHNGHSTIQVLNGNSPIPADFLLAYDFSSP
ncbi:uncharacterized protein CDV56_109063 [Aspergillus thermomutatus]|uniref:Uncharacterized protein n=1 Tax=Aspergillus thermomutatus TaxID=41047 RepID=A0A397HMQ1_ASPTH|nr:uncharacterized protein CDV56_109063 [Aspergillus thermomutatus]RHZ63248.1 hypothetical protein CDV56_109063 [Aspergillus thermomutatus]